ncbi:hypothetical protein COOONC_22831, partial [Cooperia oncophora]
MSKKGAAKKGKTASADEDLDAILAELAVEDKARAEKAGAKKGKGGKKGGKNAAVVNGGGDTIPNGVEEAPVVDWHQEIAAMKPIDEQFPDGKYPVGQCETYYLPGKDGRIASDRETSQEKKALDGSFEEMYQ